MVQEGMSSRRSASDTELESAEQLGLLDLDTYGRGNLHNCGGTEVGMRGRLFKPVFRPAGCLGLFATSSFEAPIADCLVGPDLLS